MTTYEILNKLCSTPSVSGAEDKIADVIKTLISPYTDTQRIDALGNLICEKISAKAKKTLLFCAHMDEIGYLTTGAQKDGALTIAPIGYPIVEANAYMPVRFENGVCGAIVPKAKTKLADLEVSLLLADIGAKNASDALRRVPVGTRLCAYSTLTRLNSRRVMGRALDDKAGVCTLIKLAESLKDEKNLPWNIQFLFSVQEEVGLRGAHAAAFALEPDCAICVDVTDSDDAGNEDSSLPKLGAGCCIKYKDRSVICDRRLVARLNELSKAEKIPTQAEILTCGGTDTGAIQISRAGVIAGAVSLPERYVHTVAEQLDLKDLDAAVKLLAAFARESFEV